MLTRGPAPPVRVPTVRDNAQVGNVFEQGCNAVVVLATDHEHGVLVGVRRQPCDGVHGVFTGSCGFAVLLGAASCSFLPFCGGGPNATAACLGIREQMDVVQFHLGQQCTPNVQ